MKNGREELYNLNRDPAELDNIVMEEAARGYLSKLRAKLESHVAREEEQRRVRGRIRSLDSSPIAPA